MQLFRRMFDGYLSFQRQILLCGGLQIGVVLDKINELFGRLKIEVLINK
jgi:hypothetical protein